MEELWTRGEGTILSAYEELTGKTFKPVYISPLDEVFTGRDLKAAEDYSAFCKPGKCHKNAATAVGMGKNYGFLSDWEITFCEGLAENYLDGHQHCWNKVKNKTTGKEYYVDFTLGAGRAMLCEEWGYDIVALFNRTGKSFTPFHHCGILLSRKDKRVLRPLAKHYPAFVSKGYISNS